MGEKGERQGEEKEMEKGWQAFKMAVSERRKTGSERREENKGG